MTNRLRTVHREIRVSRATGGPARQPLPPISFIFRRARGPTLVLHSHTRLSILVTPRVELTVMARARAGGGTVDNTPRQPAVKTMFRREEIVERVVRRAIRIETTAAAQGGMSGLPPPGVNPAREAQQLLAGAPALVPGRPQVVPRLPASADARGVPRVLLRTPAPAVTLPAAAPAEVIHRTPKTEAKAAEAGPGQIDINRLTDQVITAIDRRINAHRERLGRR